MNVDFSRPLYCHAASPTSRLEISELIDDSSPFDNAMSPFNARMWTSCDVIANDVPMMSSPSDYCNMTTTDFSPITSLDHVTSPLNATRPTSHVSPAPMLPPCRVCGEKASGFHYGANTCEACKGFFRRSLQRKEDYRCAGSGACEILPGRRSVCAFCRYRKCIAVGMSKKAIKTGRYTHEKKTRDIQEVKRLQQLQMMQMQSDQQPSSDALPQRQQHVHHSDADAGPLTDRRSIHCEPLLVNYMSPRTMDSSPLTSPVETNELTSSLYAADRDSVMDGLIAKITRLHEQQTPHTHEFFECLPAKENEYVAQRRLRQEVFGPMKPLPQHEYLRIYQATGIDVDGRREMIKHMIPCIEKAIKRFITFAKALPGFVELPIDDQIALIKGSRFEAWLLSAHKAFNPRLNVFTHVCGYTVHLDEMSRLYEMGFLQNVFRVAGTLQRFELSIEEECIFKGIIVMSRDRNILQQPDVVERHQMTLVEMLERVRTRRRPDDKLFVARLIGVLTDMRTLTDMHERQENKIGTEWCTDIKIPPLLYELFSV